MSIPFQNNYFNNYLRTKRELNESPSLITEEERASSRWLVSLAIGFRPRVETAWSDIIFIRQHAPLSRPSRLASVTPLSSFFFFQEHS